MVSNVVRLRQPSTELEPSTFLAAWALLPETMRRRSESRAKCEVLWDREAKRLGGQLSLLARLKTYLRDDRDLAKSGGPGLQVLMRQGRLEHWVETVSEVNPVEPFANAELRAAVAAQKGEAFCRSYLDRCTQEPALIGILIVPTHFAMDKLKELAPIFKAHGFTGMRKG
jgi:hypothetical protein